MKKLTRSLLAVLVVLLAMTLSAPVMADNIFTDGGGTGIACPADNNRQTVLHALSFNATNATGDVIFYVGDATSTTLANAESAAATALTLSSCTGIDDDDYVAIYSPTGDVMEFNQITACNDTTEVATVTALGDTFAVNSVVYELKVKATLSDVGATTLHWSNAEGILAAPRGKPIGVRITDGTIYYGTARLR